MFGLMFEKDHYKIVDQLTDSFDRTEYSTNQNNHKLVRRQKTTIDMLEREIETLNKSESRIKSTDSVTSVRERLVQMGLTHLTLISNEQPCELQTVKFKGTLVVKND